jgi:hypothetical protein
MSKSICKLIIIGFTILNISNNVYAQNSFVDLILGDMYGKTRQEVCEYLKSFSIKNGNDELDYSLLEPLLQNSSKANDTVYIESIIVSNQQLDGINFYFYLGKAYGVSVNGGLTISNDLVSILGKGKVKKYKTSAYGTIDIIKSYAWNTQYLKVKYEEGSLVPSNLEVMYNPIFTTIQKPVLKIFMQNGSGDLRPYHVEWSADSNNVTNDCSSLHRLELLGNVKNLSFVIQCLNGNEVFRKDIPQSKGKKVILTYNDLPEGCEPVTIDLGYPNDNLQSNRYIFKLYEGEYEHFSGSLHLDDCRD